MSSSDSNPAAADQRFFFGDERPADDGPMIARPAPSAPSAPSAPPTPVAPASSAFSADSVDPADAESARDVQLAAVISLDRPVDPDAAHAPNGAAGFESAPSPSSGPPPPPGPPPGFVEVQGDGTPPSGLVMWMAGRGIVAILTVVMALAGIGFVLLDPPAGASASTSMASGSSTSDRTRGFAWVEDVDAGFDMAAADGRPVLVVFTADWCPPCREMKKRVFSDDEVRSRLADEFVTVKVDLTERGGPNDLVAQAYQVRSIPSIHVYDPKGYQLAAGGASASPSGFLAFLESATR